MANLPDISYTAVGPSEAGCIECSN